MKQKRKRWTTEDDQIVISLVKDNLDNLRRAFREAAKKTNRTPAAICKRWYSSLSNPESKHYIGSTCFIGFGENKQYRNRKNYVEGYCKQKPKSSTLNMWRKFLSLFKIN